jgi:glyoxylase-like metal-dependent hydrolase (beta-lactamase superfamily II)
MRPVTRVSLHLLKVGRCRHPAWVTIRGGGLRPIEFPALAALIIHPTEGPILYDTGYADRFHDVTQPFPERFYRWMTPPTLPPHERLLTQLAAHGVKAGDISRVLVSHLHADHDVAAAHGTSALRMLLRGVIPALLPLDFATRLDPVDARPVRDLGAAWTPFARAFDLLGDGSLLGVPLPGHAPAQLGVLLRTTDDEEVLLAADACWSARAVREERRPSRLAGFIFDDWTRYCATLAGLGAVSRRQPGLTIIPSHSATARSARSRPLPVPAGGAVRTIATRSRRCSRRGSRDSCATCCRGRRSIETGRARWPNCPSWTRRRRSPVSPSSIPSV